MFGLIFGTKAVIECWWVCKKIISKVLVGWCLLCYFADTPPFFAVRCAIMSALQHCASWLHQHTALTSLTEVQKIVDILIKLFHSQFFFIVFAYSSMNSFFVFGFRGWVWNKFAMFFFLFINNLPVFKHKWSFWALRKSIQDINSYLFFSNSTGCARVLN